MKKAPAVLAIGVRKDWPLLAELLDRSLASITQEEVRRINRKWLAEIEGAIAAIKFTPEEKAWLEAHPKIRVHNETSWAPFNYYEKGTPKGLSIDYMNIVADKIGIQLEYISGPSWN